jgi:hypothetical protein
MYSKCRRESICAKNSVILAFSLFSTVKPISDYISKIYLQQNGNDFSFYCNLRTPLLPKTGPAAALPSQPCNDLLLRLFLQDPVW